MVLNLFLLVVLLVKLLLELTLGVIPSMLLISADTVSFFDVTEINFVKNAMPSSRTAGRIDAIVSNTGYPLIRALELIRQRNFMSYYILLLLLDYCIHF